MKAIYHTQVRLSSIFFDAYGGGAHGGLRGALGARSICDAALIREGNVQRKSESSLRIFKVRIPTPVVRSSTAVNPQDCLCAGHDGRPFTYVFLMCTLSPERTISARRHGTGESSVHSVQFLCSERLYFPCSVTMTHRIDEGF